MSTATLDHPVLALPAALRPGRAARRPSHLRLVEPSAPTAARQTRRRAMRITRRGRLALTSSLTLVVALVVASVIGLLGPAGATTSVVVEPGMTLSQIAAEQLPDVPLSQAIVDIQQVNRLSTTSVAAGQELVIPSR